MANLRIGDRLLAADRWPYIAMEIGGTMQGLVSAMKLLQVAADAGADAIKVQILDVDRLVGGDPIVRYTRADGHVVEEPQKEALRRRSLPREGWLALGQAARERGLDLIATVDYHASLLTALAAGAAAVKICSGDITHLEWIRRVAEHLDGQPLLLDTGHATLGELERAVDVCEGEAQVMIHHVAGGYPADPARIHLRGLPVLREMFPECAIGYSSHVDAWHVDAAAVALGAVMIEKNLTLDRQGPGPEQSTAVEPREAALFVRTMRGVHAALGTPRKRISEEERRARAGARRSAWLRRPTPAGVTLFAEDIDWRRPAPEGSIEPQDAAWLFGRQLAADHGPDRPLPKEYL